MIKQFFSHFPPTLHPLFREDQPVWQALKELENYLKSLELGKIEVDIPKGVFLIDPQLISIGKGSVVEPGAYIRGPCVIGENCAIRHGAYIRGNFLAGNGCVIGHGTEVKNAIFFEHAHAAHLSYIGDSILGARANMGAGSICSNVKLDKKNIFVKIGKELIDTGLHKFGAVIGDRCQVGCNTVLNPGTLLEKEAFCYPNLAVHGYVRSGTVLKQSNLK